MDEQKLSRVACKRHTWHSAARPRSTLLRLYAVSLPSHQITASKLAQACSLLAYIWQSEVFIMCLYAAGVWDQNVRCGLMTKSVANAHVY